MPELIQKMPTATADYFRYFPLFRDAAIWGVAVTASGFTRIRPHSPYPPTRHPVHHHFEWSQGRVLEALQVVLIAEGRGLLEMRGRPPQAIAAGDAFMLFPGVWHRYRPDSAAGWEESWVELAGPVVDRLVQQKVFAPKAPVLRNALAADFESLLEAVHARARQPRVGYDAELAARGLAVLAAWQQHRFAVQRETRMGRAVAAAERHISDHLAEPINMADLAGRLGVAYSRFRTAFKEHTGYSPWQYVLHLRLAQARRQLVASDTTVDEVAGRLGFSSAFHLSAAFKQAYGVAPAVWRRRFAARP